MYIGMIDMEIKGKYKVKIINQNSDGLGVSRIDNKVIFIENALPSEEGTVEITELKKRYAKAEIISFDRISNSRQKAPCPYYGECGGCDLQHQVYDHQLKFKENKVSEALKHIGGFKDITINKIIYDEQFKYRNKVTLKVEGIKLGFYKRNTNDIIDIDYCLISNDKINDAIRVIKPFLNKYKDNNFKSIMIRSNDEDIMISIESSNDLLSDDLVAYLVPKLDDLKSLILNSKTIYGKSHITFKIDDLKFNLSYKSFYQINNNVMMKLYEKVNEYASNIKNDTILDLYCGVGTITSLLSKQAKKVIGIEVVEEAVLNAEENAKLNSINNIEFKSGKVENVINLLKDENINTIVMDPPRSGVDRKVIDAIIKIEPKQIIYVSCDPATLARDLNILSEHNYEIDEITPFDMFPQTKHVETVTRLVIR